MPAAVAPPATARHRSRPPDGCHPPPPTRPAPAPRRRWHHAIRPRRSRARCPVAAPPPAGSAPVAAGNAGTRTVRHRLPSADGTRTAGAGYSSARGAPRVNLSHGPFSASTGGLAPRPTPFVVRLPALRKLIGPAPNRPVASATADDRELRNNE
ncbi:hypothetical protein E0H26_14280 [Micromonospora zingiberis]|uniref:Uncharacterized protein n=1 Tax=Micromonospora zingiberis TaxID=2053011 RepID=A0A4R0GJW6_9ACTN|nr:hypothetical protein E0H26_14280 [Micromonospora zingiberis]